MDRGIQELSDTAPTDAPPLPLSRDELATLLQGLDEALLIQDAAGAIVFVNEAGAHLCGFPSAAAMRDVPIRRVIERFALLDAAGDPFPLADLPAQRVYRGAPAAEAELRWRTLATGEERWSAVRATPIRDASGAVRFVASVFRDITVRVLAAREAAVQHAVSLALVEATSLDDAAPGVLRAIGEGLGWSLGALWLADPQAGALRAHAFWQRDDRVTPFVATTRTTLLPGESGLPGRVWASGEPTWVADVVKDGNFPRAELAVRVGLHAAIAFPIRSGARFLGVLEFFSRDIMPPDRMMLDAVATLGNQIGQFIERTAAATAVASSEARLRATLETALDCVIVMDHDGRIVEWNPAAEATFGHRRADAIGKQLAEMIIPPALRDAHRGGLARYLATGEGPVLGERIEVTGLRSDGREFPLEMAITRVPVEGRPIFTAYLRDITERKAAEEMRTAFLGMVAHELRTPLTAMKGYVDLMRRRGAYNARQMEVVAAQAARLNRLVSDVLDATRLDAHRLELRRSRVDLAEMVARCVAEAEELTPGRTVHMELPDHTVAGWWDSDRVCQVLQNLLANAFKYAPDGEIVVRAEGRADAAVVSVTDHGPGIPPDALTRVFDRFYRTEGAKGREAQGMGLGLSISKGLIEAHGGALWAESADGAGSTFTFTLPYDPPAD